MMQTHTTFFRRYLQDAPLALAIERTWECQILSQETFSQPVLDIGCGEGMFAEKLFVDNIAVGIDPNAKELVRAKTYHKYDQLIECFGDAVPFPDKNFPCIFSNSVMEHIPDIGNVLDEMHRLLGDDGVVYLTLPTNKFETYTFTYQILSRIGLRGLAKKYTAFFNKFWHHYHCYSAEDWKKLFQKHNLDVVESFEYASQGQCLFNSFSAPFSILPFVMKRLTNRWFICPPLRAIMASVLGLLFKPSSRLKKQPAGKGGLIFFKLKKA